MSTKVQNACTALGSMVSYFEHLGKKIPKTLTTEQSSAVADIFADSEWQHSRKAQLTVILKAKKNPAITQMISRANVPSLQPLQSLLTSNPLLPLYIKLAKEAAKDNQGSIATLTPQQKKRMDELDSLSTLPQNIRLALDEISTYGSTNAPSLIKKLLKFRSFQFSKSGFEKFWSSFTQLFTKEIPPTISSLSENHQALLNQTIVHLINTHKVDFFELDCKNPAHVLEIIESLGTFSKDLKYVSYSPDSVLVSIVGQDLYVEQARQLKFLCPHLTKLVFNDVDIRPEAVVELCELSGLTDLNLIRCFIGVIPSEIQKLVNLEKLDLGNNRLYYLPPELGKLKNLTELRLSYNCLTTLPKELAKLSKLLLLNLNHNGFIFIPCVLKDFKALQILRLDENAIEILEGINLPFSLNKLDISMNEISSISPEINTLKNLTWLNLKANKLQFLPVEIGELEHLQYLNYSKNETDLIPTFLRTIPEIVVRANPPSFSYNRSNMQSCWLQIMEEVARQLPDDCSKIYIRFANEKGIDAGGLTRELYKEIFKTFSLNCVFEGVLSWDKCKKQRNPNYTCYYAGVLMGYSYKMRGNLPIGAIFNEGVYYGLVNCDDRAIGKPYHKLTTDELVSFLDPESMRAMKIAELMEFLSSSEKEPPSENALKAVDTLFSAADVIAPNDMEQKKKVVRKAISDFCEDRIRPLLSMAKGFRDGCLTWPKRKFVGHKVMEEILQGVDEKEKVLASLDFAEVSEDHERWVKRKLRKMSNSKRTAFVTAVLGSSSIPIGLKIKIRSGPNFDAGTCFETLTIPPIFTKEVLYKEMDDMLTINNKR